MLLKPGVLPLEPGDPDLLELLLLDGLADPAALGLPAIEHGLGCFFTVIE